MPHTNLLIIYPENTTNTHSLTEPYLSKYQQATCNLSFGVFVAVTLPTTTTATLTANYNGKQQIPAALVKAPP